MRIWRTRVAIRVWTLFGADAPAAGADAKEAGRAQAALVARNGADARAANQARGLIAVADALGEELMRVGRTAVNVLPLRLHLAIHD